MPRLDRGPMANPLRPEGFELLDRTASNGHPTRPSLRSASCAGTRQIPTWRRPPPSAGGARMRRRSSP
eukprot:7651390-Pyramimonas_sp.AAC.1